MESGPIHFPVTNRNAARAGPAHDAGDMRVLAFLATAITLAAHAQAAPTYGCDSPESKALDFWIGEWELTYQGDDGKPAKSRNRITKVLDGCAVLEEFRGAPGTKLDGRSYSSFDRATRQWKQTWVDNTAAYLDFAGGTVDGQMYFAREVERQGKRVKQRMIFQDVQKDSLTWRWQRSDDGGITWLTQWEIGYRRLK
jgi:hypothetical protein